jgi:hypothetical protein
MSGQRRKGKDKPKPRTKRSKHEVSLADRLGPTTATKVPPGGSVLPGGAEPATRRAAREQRKQQVRKRWGIVAAVVVGVLVLGLVAVWWSSREDDAAPVQPAAGRTERTLTMTLADSGDPATSGTLLVADPAAGSADAILVPSRVFVDGPAPEGIPFGDTVLLGSASAPGDALADTLDITMDSTWQLDTSALAALVDGVEGVLVDVDTEVLTPRSEGPQRVLIGVGDQQLLNGTEAVAFAQYLAPGEPEEARLARLGQVVDQLTRRLPQEQAAIATLLTKTRADATITGTVDELAAQLLAFGNVARDGDAGFQVLPTTPIGIGGPNPALTVDAEGAERLRQTVLSGSLPTGAAGTGIEVLVQNGVGTPGLEQEAADLLRAEGYEFVNGGNATSFKNKQTDVLIMDTSTASVELGNAVAETLGVPQSAVQTTDQGSAVADVIVILGADFDP